MSQDGKTPLIEIRDLRKVFDTPAGKVVALDGINLSIDKGEIFGIIGMSGAGKSTLVRCINLLERPTSGAVIVEGQDITQMNGRELRRARHKIAMIFQLFNLMKSRTIYANVMFPLKGSGLSRQEKHDKVMKLLKIVGLEDRAKAYPSQLSGGQKQRVAIARALANDPSVLLCDEATSALDPQTTQDILKLLKELNQQLGITIIIITHEMAVVKEVCTRVAVTEDGHVKETGGIYDVFANPQTPITKRFIATTSNMNKIYEELNTHPEVLGVKQGDVVATLEFTGDSTGEAMISHLSREYNVDVNIIFGNVELLAGNPFGKLVVAFRGDKQAIDAALKTLVDHQVRTEVLLHA